MPAGRLKFRKKITGESGEVYDAEETYYKYDSVGNLIESKSLIIVDKSGKEFDWTINKYDEYDIYGNLLHVVYDYGNDPIEISYEYDHIQYNSAYMTTKKQYISDNFVDNIGDTIYDEYATTIYKYDFKTGNQKEITDPKGNTIIYEYDTLGRVLKVTYPLLENETESAYEEVIYYDDENKVEVYDAERKSLTIHYYDGLGRETKTEKYNDINGEDLHSEISKTYNWQNKVYKKTDPNGKVTTNNYDIFGRLKKTITDDSVKTKYEYDDLSRKKIITDPKGVEKTIITDKKGQKVEESVENITNKYEYDGYGNIIKTTDGEDKEKAFIYNNRGLLEKTKYPDSSGDADYYSSPVSTEYNFYDTKGNLVRTRDREGQEITYYYNEYGQIIEQSITSSGQETSHYYNVLGQLVKVEKEGEYEKIFAYDNRGRLTDEKIIIDGEKTYENHYDYNKNNQLVSQTYPKNNKTLRYDYNNLNQLNYVRWNGRNVISSVDYNKAGHIENISYANGIENEYKYKYISGAYLPYHVNYGPSVRFDYRYDILGNITRINDQTYRYDDVGRLVNWSYLKDNDQVLLGQEKLWEKEMNSAEGINLNQTMLLNDKLQLAVNPAAKNQRLFTANYFNNIDDDENNSIYNTENKYNTESDEGIFKLKRNDYYHFLYFSDDIFAGTDNSVDDVADVDPETGYLTIPQNSDSDGWEEYAKDETSVELDKTINYVDQFIKYIELNKSYKDEHCYEEKEWEPPIADNQNLWDDLADIHLDGSPLGIMKKIKIIIESKLVNKFYLLEGGYANYHFWIKVKINGVYTGEMFKFKSPIAAYKYIQKELTFDLEELGLLNKDSYYFDIDINVHRWGMGDIPGGTVRWVYIKGKEKYVYPTDITKTDTFEFSKDFYKDSVYKYIVDEKRPTGDISHKLYDQNSNFIEDLSNQETFQVEADGKYKIETSIKTDDKYEAPEVNYREIQRKDIYKDTARMYLSDITLPNKSSSFELTTSDDEPEGTDITYEVGLYDENTGIYDYKIANEIDDNDNIKSVEFNRASDKVRIRMTLSSNENNTKTPVVRGLFLNALESGTYKSSGYLETEDLANNNNYMHDDLTELIILELQGKKLSNEEGISVSMEINGKNCVGKYVTDINDLIEIRPTKEGNETNNTSPLSYSLNAQDTSTTDTGPAEYYPVEQRAVDIQQDISDKDLETYYYVFNFKEYDNFDDVLESISSAKLKIELTPNSDRRSSPSVYGYILYNDYLQYYTDGSYESADNIRPVDKYKFNKIRLDVNQQTNNGSSEFSLYDNLNSSEINIMPGNITYLNNETDSVKLKGILERNNRYSPEITDIQLTAIGETPLKNDLETTDDIDTTDGNITISQDSVVGSSSISINQNGKYVIEGESINRKKLPIVTLWVKPLSEGSIRFAVSDDDFQTREYINSDKNSDSYFDEQDLELDSWNMVKLDLRKLYGKYNISDIVDLRIDVESGAKILVDGVNSLPLNEVSYQYDNAGNRTDYTINGVNTDYHYVSGSNWLDYRRNNSEDLYVDYSYDNNGNMISQSVNNKVYSYNYNELNQLVEVSLNNDLIAEYKYDHTGLRYKKIEYLPNRTKTTIYIYGQGTEPIYEEVYYDGSTSPDKAISYLFMGGKRVARDENGIIIYNYTDHLGSTRAVQRGGNITRLDYAPFGEELTDSSEKYKFTGKEQDVSTGLYYYNARYYDPAVARFITEDSARDGINWYTYCRNNRVPR